MLPSTRSLLRSLLAASLLLTASAFAAEPPSQAETLANDATATPTQTAATMQAIRARGLGTVTVDIWNNGQPQFPSAVMKSALGAARPLGTPRRDRLQEALIEAHRNGLNFIAWFQDGFMLAQKDSLSSLRAQKPEWLSRAANGSELAPDGSVWLSPMHPQARQFMLDLAVEVADKYDIDGIRFDEQMVLPQAAIAYDASTRAAYSAEHGGGAPPADANDAEWLRWRAGKINEFGAMLREAVNAKRPSMRVLTRANGSLALPPEWRTPALVLIRSPGPRNLGAGQIRWRTDGLAKGRYRLIGHDGKNWEYLEDIRQDHSAPLMTSVYFFEPFSYTRVELLLDRRADMRRTPAVTK
jgi:hypothetical protein